MPRALPVFPTFFALYVSIVVVFLLAGLGPPLAGALPGVAETFEAWGEGEGPLSELWRGMAEAGALTYDAFGLLVEAVKNQGKVDPGAIREGLAGIRDYRGVTGFFQYDGISGDPIRSVVLMKIENGEFVFHSRVDP